MANIEMRMIAIVMTFFIVYFYSCITSNLSRFRLPVLCSHRRAVKRNRLEVFVRSVTDLLFGATLLKRVDHLLYCPVVVEFHTVEAS